MQKPLTALSWSFFCGLLAALVCLAPLHAQTPVNAPAANNGSSAQAPDETTAKITSLVNAGKYAEAQQLTTGLLVAYPDDQRLTKAKALLEKILAPPVSTDAAPQPTTAPPSQPAANKNPEHLTGMDKVDFDSVIELGREAQQTTDPDQQKKLLQEFMDKSTPFLQKHRDELLLWQLRAACAISLNDPLAGYEAGQALLASSTADSDPLLRHLLSQLDLKGWMDKQRAMSLAGEKNRRFEAETMAKISLSGACLVSHDRQDCDSKMGEFTSESFVLTDHEGNSETFRFDQIHTFQPSNPGLNFRFWHLELKGKPGEPDCAWLFWDKKHSVAAQNFGIALSALAKSSPAAN